MENTDIIVAESQKVILQGNPAEQIQYARKAADALLQVIESKQKPVLINGERYIEFEDWMMIARFYGMTVGIEWTRPILQDEKIWGYEARALVYREGQIISSAEAMCTRDEPRWDTRWNATQRRADPVPDFQRRSMSQTRASAKALRNVLAWVVVLAGFRPTPAEEMDGVSDVSPSPKHRATGQIGGNNKHTEGNNAKSFASSNPKVEEMGELWRKLGTHIGSKAAFDIASVTDFGSKTTDKNIDERIQQLKTKVNILTDDTIPLETLEY